MKKQLIKIFLGMAAAVLLLLLYHYLSIFYVWLLAATALYFGIEASYGERLRIWWKGVKHRAKVNQHYREQAKAYEKRLKKNDSWRH